MTLGLMRAINERGVRCPEGMSIPGFDDFDWAANSSPRLSTVAQSTNEIGKQAIRLLLEEMEDFRKPNGNGKPRRILMPAELRIRNSTAPPPIAS
jgi:DNA-binding LacI/PurR family transcriptional regulator